MKSECLEKKRIGAMLTRICKERCQAICLTAVSYYCCTARDSLKGDQLTAQFEVNSEEKNYIKAQGEEGDFFLSQPGIFRVTQ